MSNKVTPVPKGFKTITPCLSVRGVDAAVEFYSAAFGAKEQKRLQNTDQTATVYAELKVGTSVVILTEEAPFSGLLSPQSLGGSAAHGHIYIKNVDDFIQTAIENGATELGAAADTYWGDRMATIVDPFGHVWTVASRIEDLSDEEIQERASALLESPVAA